MKSYLSSSFTRLVISLASLITALALAASCNSGATGRAPADGPFNATCSVGLTDCGNGDCRDLSNDASSCGSCGNACSGAAQCVGGTCQCPAGYQDCGAGCIPIMEDPANCGGCNVACAAPTPFCSVGACAASCGANLTACGNSCVDLNTSLGNCGSCAAACGAGQSCAAGQCSCATVGQESCGGMCVSTQTSSQHCGGCNLACAPGQTCVGGMCQGGSSGNGGASAVTNASTSTTSPSTTTDATTTGSGGASTTGATTGGSGNAPPGYWTYGDWAGCVWTGIDTVAGTTTTVTPQDFTSQAPGESYCVSGQVHDDYESVALLGFNLAEPAETADCTYDPNSATEAGPPEVTLGGQGLAVNFTKVNASTTLRVQIQGSNGATDENNRWCATITEVQGKVFVAWSEFNTACWDGSGNTYAGEPISAVVFLVPGVAPGSGAEPYEYCIHGFATGSTADDAPDGGGDGSLMGSIGGPGSDDVDFQRVKVQKDGEQYIIQNNNWGNPSGSDQTINYVDNSFTVVSSTGSGSGANVVAFPSIYIGANGDTQNGQYDTSATDGLPAQLSGINSVTSTFRWSGGQSGGEYNVTYDIWFSDQIPSAPYDDGLDGFVMLWLYDPPGSQPIGSVQGTYSGAGHTWDVWVGPRGGGGPNNNAPVVSYVAQGGANALTNVNLMDFIRNAEQYGINQSWYLTDVFGGFEIWQGSHATGLKMEEYTAVVQ